jgi:hypothetical protein
MTVEGDFVWRGIKNAERSSLQLMGARTKVFSDDRASWPEPGNLRLNGLVVQDFSPLEAGSLDTNGRIAWLNLQPECDLAEPQPWVHLAKLLEDKGQKRAARRVVFELHKHQSKANREGPQVRLARPATGTALRPPRRAAAAHPLVDRDSGGRLRLRLRSL